MYNKILSLSHSTQHAPNLKKGLHLIGYASAIFLKTRDWQYHFPTLT
jgi:hypothetical protein